MYLWARQKGAGEARMGCLSPFKCHLIFPSRHRMTSINEGWRVTGYSPCLHNKKRCEGIRGSGGNWEMQYNPAYNRLPCIVAPTTQIWPEINMCVCGGNTETSRGKVEGVEVCLCTSGVLVLYVCIFVIMECVCVCVCLRVKKMNEFPDRGVTWLECKSRCGCLLFSISPTKIVYQRDWKEAVCWMLWADIAWLCLPCVVADVCRCNITYFPACVVKYFCDIPPGVFHDL